ncbi:MAG: hypothetical protein ACTSRU_15505 [Candidatus Hodarchaeales archaeon]
MKVWVVAYSYEGPIAVFLSEKKAETYCEKKFNDDDAGEVYENWSGYLTIYEFEVDVD